MLNLFVGNKESLVRKSVLRWGTTDVVKWVRSLGSWAQGYDEKFLTAGIDGNLLLSLSEYDLEHSPLNMKPSYHRRAFLKEIENLRTLGVKSPTDVWEYKVGCHVRCNNGTNGGGGVHGYPRTPPSYAPVAISRERGVRTVKLEYWSFHLFFFGDEHILKIE